MRINKMLKLSHESGIEVRSEGINFDLVPILKN